MGNFRIVASPAPAFVTRGTSVTYAVRRDSRTAPNLNQCTMTWSVRNDPTVIVPAQPPRVPAHRLPSVVAGPRGQGMVQWRDAQWDYPGNHVVVCRVTHNERTAVVEYPQVVVPFASELQRGIVLPRQSDDPVAYYYAVYRFIDLVSRIEAQAPTAASLREQQEEEREALWEQIERLRFLLAGRRGWMFRERNMGRLQIQRFVGPGARPFAAEFMDQRRGSRTRLRMASISYGDGIRILDWTVPADPGQSGGYEGRTMAEALRAWDEGNRYARGAITYSYSTSDRHVNGNFDTDGASFTDAVVSNLTTMGLITGAVVLALTPIPGSQVAALAVASLVFTGTAAAISISDRHLNGIHDTRADVIDTLTVVSCLVGSVATAATTPWRVGARVALTGNAARYLLVGDLGLSALQGVLVTEQQFAEYRRIVNDRNSTAADRARQLMNVTATATANAALLFFNIRGTQAQIRGLSPDMTRRIDALMDTNQTLTVPSSQRVGGSTRTAEVDGRVRVDEEGGEVRPSPRAPRVAPTIRDRLRRIMGAANFDARAAEVPRIRANAPEVAHLTDEEIIAIRGYADNLVNDTLSEGIQDYIRINRALRTRNRAELAALETYIQQIRSGMRKLPEHRGTVFRILKNVDPSDVRAEFAEGKRWKDLGFLSTSAGRPMDHSRVTIQLEGTSGGRAVGAISPYPEREILFEPGARFKVIKTLDTGGFLYIIMEAL